MSWEALKNNVAIIYISDVFCISSIFHMCLFLLHYNVQVLRPQNQCTLDQNFTSNVCNDDRASATDCKKEAFQAQNTRNQYYCEVSSRGAATLIFLQALLNPETSILIQKRHSHTRNLNSETPGDSKNAFLHCGDVLALAA